MPNRCYNCKFFARQDSGYSNYTTESTEISCLKNHFETTEESYSWRQSEKDPENDADFFKIAEICPDFKFSENQIHLDVDEYGTIEDYKDDPELYEAAKLFYAKG